MSVSGFTPKLSSATKRGKLASVSILVVDDDAQIASLMSGILNTMGFQQVHVAHSVREGFDILNTTPIDILFTDWVMEPLDGLHFVKRIRASSDMPYQNIPIIMVTGVGEEEDIRTARDAGVTEFILKPFSVQTLCDRLILIFENPRSFVKSRGFTGHDRRRRAARPPGQERRKRRT